MEFLLITGAAVLIAILIDRNIDKIDIPKGPVSECLEPDMNSDDSLFDDDYFDDDFDPSLPGTLAWIARHKD